MKTQLRLQIAGRDLDVSSLSGDEALNHPYRFDIELSAEDLGDVLGEPAKLHIGSRVVDGIIAESDSCGDQHRLTLAPRLWLLSLAIKSRIFRDLSLPQIASAVAASAGVAVDLRLTRAYAVERFVVQYRESDLAFLSRLLEAEGVAYHFAGETLVLSDHNGAFDDSVDVALTAMQCRRRLTPSALLLHDGGAVEAHVDVDARGFGMQIEDGVALRSPELGQQVAARRAEEMRSRATRYRARSKQAVAPGQRVDAHIVVASKHSFDGYVYRTDVEAIDAGAVYRPAIVTPKPRVEGVMRATVDADADERGRYSVALPFDVAGNRGHGSEPLQLLSPDEGARFTLRQGTPVALGFVDGDPSRPLIAGAVPATQKSPDRNVIRTPQGAIIEMSGSYASAAEGEAHSMDGALTELRPLTGLVVTATGGDTAVSLVWAADADAVEYQVWRDGVCITTVTANNYEDTGLTNGTSYAYVIKPIDKDDNVLTTGTASGTPVAEVDGVYIDESSGASDWIRFAVPHGDGKWSYLRYGEKTTESVASADETAGTFAEKGNVEGPFESKYFDSDGETVNSGQSSFEWSSLDDDAYDMNAKSSDESKGSKSYFCHNQSAGIFNYTDGNRTTITRGDHQSVTEGHRTDVVLGDYRLVIPNRTNGVYDADTYWMRYRKASGSWRKTERSHLSSDSITWGDTESCFLGFTIDGFFGTKVDVTVGAEVDAFVGYKLDIGAGITANFDLGHSFDYAFGKQFSKSTKHELEATKRITMRIPGPFERTKEAKNRIAAAAVLTAVSGGLIFASTGTFAGAEPLGDAKWPTGLTLAGASTAAFVAALVSYYFIKDRTAKPEEPSIEMTSDSIVLSIGDAAIELEKDCIALGVGDSTGILIEDGFIGLASDETEVTDNLVVGGKFDVTAGPGTIANKSIEVK